MNVLSFFSNCASFHCLKNCAIIVVNQVRIDTTKKITNAAMSELEDKFDQEMLGIYNAAQEHGYHATQLLRMINQKGGYETAKQLIRSSQISEGFRRLADLGKLDITIEAKVLLPEYHDLFDEKDREKCRERLEEYGYQG